ncbi:MAG: GAF domain-containing protein [Anaerolineae bacterium]|nr:GAF domain-containing protein [Anaerolineae bacterium]
MGLAIILFLGGAVIFVWLYLWLRQHQNLGQQPAMEQVLHEVPAFSGDDAVLVSREHGQLVYVNDRARRWLEMNGSNPNLEYVARFAEPSDSFLELFAREFQTSFQLGPRWVEASSHRIPAGSEMRTVVVMRELGATTTSPEALDLSQAMTIINTIGEMVNASQSVEQVLQSLLSIVNQAVPAAAGEICLWDEAAQVLHPRGWIGDAAYVLRLAEAGGVYQVGEGITGWIAQHRRPVLSVDPSAQAAILPKLSDSLYSSFIGVPLVLSERFVGTFELAAQETGAFTQRDLALLQAISKQLAIAIHNAELYTAQSQRIEDMVSLQQVMQQADSGDYVRSVYAALHERLARFVGADMCGILLYDAQKQALVPQLPFHGVPDQVTRQYDIPMPAGSPQRHIWEQQSHWISNDVTDEPLIEVLGLMSLVNVTGIYNTALIPMEIGDRRIGAIQLSNKRAEGGFTLRDVQNLRILVAQAAIVVENTRLYQLEESREVELLGLQEITHAISVFGNEDGLFAEINQRIASLMQSELCGILLHDAADQTLVARAPFYGVARDQVHYFDVPLTPGSRIEALWHEEDAWYTNAVATDRVIIEAGLEALADVVGARQLLMVPLSIGGRRLGVVQVANKNGGAPFDDEDVRLLTIFATQAAAIIENARLYRDLEQRASESEGLRRIAELAGALLTADEPLTPVLAEIASLTHSPIVFVSVFDETGATLLTYPRYVYGIELGELLAQAVTRETAEAPVAVSRRMYVNADVAARQPVAYYNLTQQLDITALAIVPLLVGDRCLGELGVANRAEPPYRRADDEAVLRSVAMQVAAALDRVTLYQSAGQNLNRRMQELDAISRVSNELTLTLDFDHILGVILDEAIKASGADGGTVALLRPAERWRVPGQPEIERRIGDALDGLADVERQAVARRGEAVLVSDYAEAEGYPLPAAAQSALATAFIYEDQVVGIIHLYHQQPHTFDERESEFLRTLAAKAALGHGNAIRYEDQVERSNQLRRRVEQLNQIFELGQMLQTNTDPVIMLEAIAYSVQQSVGYDVVLMLLLDEDDGILRRTAQAGLPLDVFQASKGQVLPRETLFALQNEQYRISESYFFPADRRAEWGRAGDLSALDTTFDGQRMIEAASGGDWHMGDLLLVPLNNSAGSVMGLMALDSPQDNRRPGRFTIELLEIFGHQAATTIENTRLYLDSITSAEQQARLNEIMETIASHLDIASILQAMARGALRMLPFMRMTAALIDQDRQVFDILRIVVRADSSLDIQRETWPSLDHSALGRSYAENQDYLYYAGEAAIDNYDDLRDWHTNGERTSLVMPVAAGGERLGALHIGSDLVHAFGFVEFRPLLRRMANLAAVAIQNTHLLEHAVDLRQFNESVVQSIQQGIVVLDKSGRIMTLNAFMRQRYAWEASAIGQDLFEYRPELRRPLLESVRRTLDAGELQEHLQLHVNFNERPQVCNIYIYPLGSTDQVRGAVLLLEDLTERAQLEHDLEARAIQLAALTEVSSRITASLDHSEVVALALSALDRIIEYDTLTFWLRDGDFLVLQGAKDYEDDTMPVGAKVRVSSHDRLSHVVDERKVYSISRLQGWDALPGEHGAQSWMGVPLVSQGHVVGVIALCKAEPGYYDRQAEQAAFAFGNQVAVALANADLFREAERRTQRLSLLNRVSVALGQSLDSEDILEIALREIAHVLSMEQAFGLMFERDLQIGRVVVEHPRGDKPPDKVIDLRSSPTYHHIRRTVKTLMIQDITEAPPELADVVRELAPRMISAYVLIPMAIGGQVIGAFEMVDYGGPRTFDPEQTDLGRIIANQAAIAIQNTSLLEQTLVRSRELETLLEAAQATSLTLDVREVYRSVVELMMHALDMDDCALMIWDDVDRTVEVQVDVNRSGNPDRISAPGTRLNLSDYPTKLRALEKREVVLLSRDSDDLSGKERQELEVADDMAQMLVPLIARDSVIGLVQLELEAEYRTFTHREIRLAQALGAQAATAIENARLSTETANRVEELYIINDFSQAISATTDIEEMMRMVRDRVPGVTGVEELYLALHDVESGEITFPLYVRNGVEQEMPARQISDDEVSFILRNRRPLSMGSDYFSPDELRRSLGIRNTEGDVKSYLGVPLISGDQVLGVLAVRDPNRTRAFGVNSQGILMTVAAQLAAAIQNAHLIGRLSSVNDELSLLNRNLEQAVETRTEELSEERDRVNTLYRITAELARTLDLERVLRRALEMVAGAVGAEDGVIMQINPTTDLLHPRAALGLGAQASSEDYVHPASALATALVQEQGTERAYLVDDLMANEYWDPTVPGAEGYRSALAVLLEINDDILGVMILLSQEQGVFTQAHVRLVLAAANQVAAAINNSDLYYLNRDQAERLGMLVLAEQQEAQKGNAILEGIADGVMLADSSGQIVRFNTAAERILELPRRQVIGQSMSTLVGLQARWMSVIERWSKSPDQDPSDGFLSDQIEIGQKMVNVRLSPVRTDSQYLGTVLVFRDVTKEFEADRLKSEFISNVSHELRTPMTSIKGYADLMALGAAGGLTDPQKDFIAKIKANADRLGILVDDLLNISKIDAGTERLALAEVDMGHTLQTVINNLQGRAEHERKQIQVSLHVAPDLPTIEGDPNKITQIFTNLVDNAFNYTYAGGSIDLDARRDGDDRIVVAVQDTGIGIADEFKDRIWERFGRYEEHALVMDVAGTGLGLPIVKTLVEMHGGQVWFETELGKGTTFFVSLPVEQAKIGQAG